MIYVPITPSDTPIENLKSNTEKEAWDKLAFETRHMPYDGISGLKDRGYTVECWNV